MSAPLSRQAHAIEPGTIIFTGAYVRVVRKDVVVPGVIPVFEFKCEPAEGAAKPEHLTVRAGAHAYVSTFPWFKRGTQS